MSESHPELEGYVPIEQKPLRSRRTVWVIRLGVLLAIAGFVLPGIFTIVGGGSRTAQQACAVRVGQISAQVASFEARFELFGPGILGWECYSLNIRGAETHVASLGLIPVIPRQESPPLPVT